MIEVCISCNKNQQNISKKEIIKEIRAFLKDPNSFYVRYNPNTGFYKFEKDKKN